MENVETALEALRELLDLPRLSFNDDGQASILVENTITIDVSKQSDTELELSTAISGLYGELTGNRALALLQGNYLGHYTGAARLAIDPRDAEPILCQRLDVAGLDAARLEAAFVAFVGYASYWLSTGTDRVLAIPDVPVDGSTVAPEPNDLLMMRM